MRHEDGDTVLGKIAIAGIRGGHRSNFSRIGAVTEAFVAAKKEHLIGNDLAARGTAELIAPEGELGRVASAGVDVVEEVLRVQGIIPKEIVGGAVKSIGAALGDGIQLRSASAKLGRVGIGLHLKFLNFVNGGHRSKRIEVGRSVGSAVQKKIRILS